MIVDDDILTKFRAAVLNCDESELCSNDYFLRFWYKNKKHLFPYFGKDLIIKLPFEYKEPINSLANKIYQSSEFNALMGIYNANETFLSFTPEEIGSNTLLEQKKYKDQIFKPGMKVTKMLKKIAVTDLEQRYYEAFRLKQSQIFNIKEYNGTLCFSIHPMDYLTASVNDYDWTSCLNIYTGSSKAGCIEAMNSTYIIVAYMLADDSSIGLDTDCYWNNKIWREFFIVSPSAIVGLRGFPYTNISLEKYCVDYLKNLQIFPEANYEYKEENFYTQDKKRFFTLNLYNDFNYIFADYNKPGYYSMDEFDIVLAQETTCLKCGSSEHMTDTEFVLCHKCLPRKVCQSCGVIVPEKDMYTIQTQEEGLMEICDACYNWITDPDNHVFPSITFEKLN